ncbi:hypothetical protein NUW54_g6027 [Trametes sanguinea]|uniref:Uncharacterized protein n=1 Tax=Trametes sanguinea TaxID=158606 RepID=A0ACC1PVB3_9APHY|nr:hypothetical protein NUW54_g6027 [Trametes sanguinea]
MHDAEAAQPPTFPVPDAGPASSANVNGLSLIRSIPHHQFLHGVIESLREFEEDWLLKLSEAGAPHVSNDDPVLKSESGLIALSIQGTVIFMPTRLLSTITDQLRARSDPTSVSPVCRTVTHDVESFGWVMLYIFYRRALKDEELKQNDSELHERLSYEFLQMFPAASVKTLHTQRVSLLAREDYSPIAMLQAYADDYLKSRPKLATFLKRVWTVLKRCPKTEPSVSKPASDDLGEARLLRVANNKRRQLGRKNQWTERSLPPVPSEEAQERWNNIDHIEWLTLLSVMMEDLEKDERN